MKDLDRNFAFSFKRPLNVVHIGRVIKLELCFRTINTAAMHWMKALW